MKILHFFILLSLSSIVCSFDNVISGTGITPENEDSLRGTSLPYAIARQGQRAANNEEVVQGFFELDNNIYSVSSEPSLVQTKKEGRVLLGNWRLTPWQNTVRMLGEGVSWQVRPYLTAESGRGYQAIEDPKIMALDSPTEYKLSPFIQTTGCLASQPLRFGDIDGNGSSELVLFLDNDLIVFSPSLKKIIFAMPFSENDEINADEV